jgi:hypothetical protein
MTLSSLFFCGLWNCAQLLLQSMKSSQGGAITSQDGVLLSASLIIVSVLTVYRCVFDLFNMYNILVRKPEVKWPLGRLWYRQQDNVKMDREIGWAGVDWMHLAEDRDQWQALVNTVMNLWGSVWYSRRCIIRNKACVWTWHLQRQRYFWGEQYGTRKEKIVCLRTL